MIRLSCVILLLWMGTTDLSAATVFASDFGFSAEDATDAFQKAVKSSADTVIIDLQSSDWMVGPSDFYDLHDKTIIFQPGVNLTARHGAFPNKGDCLIYLIRAKNLRIIGYGATFRMNKAEYAALGDGEWRHSLALGNCSNVEVCGLSIIGSGGDGLYVTGASWAGDQHYSENILFQDIWCDDHYRQGLSVISAHNLDTASIPLDIVFRDCYVSSNHDIDHPYTQTEIYANGTVRGRVLFERCMVENSQWTAVNARKTAYGYKLNFRDCVFRNVSQNTTKSKYNSPIWMEVTDYSQACPRFGGVAFRDCLLEYSTAYNFFDTYGEILTSPGLGNVQIDDLTVIHPNGSVTYNVTRGGGSPSEDCMFGYHAYTKAPSAVVSFVPVLNLFECSGFQGTFQATRVSENTEYPLGISYTMEGSARQGEDYGRMSGLIIIPADVLARTDTIRILDDGLAESPENINFKLDSSTIFASGSQPPAISLSDCESFDYGKWKGKERYFLFPNPCSDVFEISFTGEGCGFVQLIDNQGRIVLSRELWAGGDRIPVHGLKGGIYIARIRIEGMSYMSKLIIL